MSFKMIRFTLLITLFICLITSSFVLAQNDPLKQEYDFARDAFNNGKNATDPASKDKYFDEALTKFKAIVEKEANYSPAWYHMGLIYYERNQFSQAIEPLINVTKIDTTISTLAGCNFYIGMCYTKLNQSEESVTWFEKALDYEPNNQNYIYQVGETYQKMNKPDKAIPYFEKIIAKNPSSDLAKSASFFLRGHYYETRQYDRALHICEEIAKVNPNDVDNNIIIGSIYQMKNDYDSAIRAFNYVIEIDPTKCQILNRLGSLWMSKQNYAKALEYYPKSIACDAAAADALTYYSWGRALFANKNLEEAIGKFNKAVEMNSKYTDAYTYKAKAELQLQEFDKALESINKALNIQQSIFGYVTRGEILAKLHKFKEDPREQIKYLEDAMTDFKRGLNDKTYKEFSKSYIDYCQKTIEIIKDQNIIID